MSKQGKFIANNLMDKRLEMFVNLDSEWLSYQDGDAQSYTIVMATPIAYDEDSGILTLKNDKNQTFYVNEGFIDAFWEADSGFKLSDSTTSTLHHAKRARKRDIMQ